VILLLKQMLFLVGWQRKTARGWRSPSSVVGQGKEAARGQAKKDLPARAAQDVRLHDAGWRRQRHQLLGRRGWHRRRLLKARPTEVGEELAQGLAHRLDPGLFLERR
jgi:hypothetical protein